MGIKVADPVVKPCPACASEKTAIQPLLRWESLLGITRRLRKYRCLACSHEFRAADRRKFRRPERSPAH
jgi:hypothetical protein